MLLIVHSSVLAQIKIPLKQAGFIISRAQAVKELAEDIATELEERGWGHTRDYVNG